MSGAVKRQPCLVCGQPTYLRLRDSGQAVCVLCVEEARGWENMGPYCEYCGNRCFVRVLTDWPEHILEAYRGYSIAASCQRGRAFEELRLGYSYGDVLAARAAVNEAELILFGEPAR